MDKLEVWAQKGLVKQQDVIDAINEAYLSKERLGSNIYIGSTSRGNICIILDHNTGKIGDAFPVVANKRDYDAIKQDVNDTGLGKLDDMHLEIVSLAITIDFLNHQDEFLRKQEIYDNCSLFHSSVHETESGTIIVISVEGLGQLVVGYDEVKAIVEKYRTNRVML